MISFMFATLGSVTFWVVYFVLSLFVSTITLKTLAKETFSYITGKKNGTDYWSSEIPGYVVITGLHLLFWPFILIGVAVYLVIYKMVGPMICKLITSIDKMVPTVKFENSAEPDSRLQDAIDEVKEEMSDSVEDTIEDLKIKLVEMLENHLFFGIKVPISLLIEFTSILNDQGLYYRVSEHYKNYDVVAISKDEIGIDLYDEFIKSQKSWV